MNFDREITRGEHSYPTGTTFRPTATFRPATRSTQNSFFQSYDSMDDFRKTLKRLPFTAVNSLNTTLDNLCTLIKDLSSLIINLATLAISDSGKDLFKVIVAPFYIVGAVLQGCFDTLTSLVKIGTRSLASLGAGAVAGVEMARDYFAPSMTSSTAG